MKYSKLFCSLKKGGFDYHRVVMGMFKLGPNQREGGEVVGMQAMVKQGTE